MKYRILVEDDLRDYKGFPLNDLTCEDLSQVLVSSLQYGGYKNINYKDGEREGFALDPDGQWKKFTIK
jgi:hypothetical protein